MNRPREDAPPPGMWLTVLVLVTLFLLPLYGAFRLGWLADIDGRHNVASQWPRYRPDAGGSVVMGVGSSLLQAGVAHAELVEDDRSQWLLFSRAAASYQNFGALLRSQWPVRPQVLIFQTDMFQTQTPDPKAFLVQLQMLVRQAMRWVMGREPPPADETVYPPASPDNRQKTAELVDLYRPQRVDQVQVIEWLRLQQSRGIQVVLLDIPRAPSMEKAIGAPLVRWRAEIQIIAMELQVPLLHFDGPLTDADFYDGSHMKPSSRRRHTRWLQQKVGSLLHESS